jgi:septal ring factor EnvC (AmiA/AmiB activator)
MSRTKGILAAGTFTGLILIIILAFGFGSSQAQSSATATAAPTEEVISSTTETLNNEEALQAWQDYSAQLEQTVRILQERDNAYRQQLEASNQTILQLQNQINSARARPTFAEHEEHEHEEHEGFEFGDFDD